jgi:hypothetical protein
MIYLSIELSSIEIVLVILCVSILGDDNDMSDDINGGQSDDDADDDDKGRRYCHRISASSIHTRLTIKSIDIE